MGFPANLYKNLKFIIESSNKIIERKA